jgi:hypothetical protein
MKLYQIIDKSKINTTIITIWAHSENQALEFSRCKKDSNIKQLSIIIPQIPKIINKELI